MKIRWVDRLAFFIINHCLSRPRFQRFDAVEQEQFIQKWSQRTAENFYDLSSLPSGTDASLEALASGPFPQRKSVSLPSPSPGPCQENNHIWVEFHLGRPLSQAPLFLIQHGWRSVSVRGYHGLCGKLNALGVNAGVLHLPYHFSRKARGSFNGELAITSNLERSAFALKQGVREACWLKNQLKRLGVPSVGLWGTSYGAWIAALAIVMDDGFDGALLLEPPVDIETLFWEIPLFSVLQRELHRHRISRERVRPLFKLVTPGEKPLRLPPERVLILGSLHDPIGSPDSLARLHRAWPGSYLEIFPCGHISYRLHINAMARFLERLAPALIRS
ncbi:MAG: hypothetical protein PHV34_21365 [Verrucomicrobiae bacterium]|nr:hypothetical protein [Verrucomicrobiae bacterium]